MTVSPIKSHSFVPLWRHEFQEATFRAKCIFIKARSVIAALALNHLSILFDHDIPRCTSKFTVDEVVVDSKKLGFLFQDHTMLCH